MDLRAENIKIDRGWSQQRFLHNSKVNECKGPAVRPKGAGDMWSLKISTPGLPSKIALHIEENMLLVEKDKGEGIKRKSRKMSGRKHSRNLRKLFYIWTPHPLPDVACKS